MIASIRQWVVGGMVGGGLLTQVCVAQAVPVTIQDQYGVASDVIGELADFDINKIVFTSLTSTNITVDVYFNFHNATLTPWIYTPANPDLTLAVGDLVFDVEGVYKYGVALTSRIGPPAITAGHLYNVTDFLTSDEATSGHGVSYRTGQLVQIQAGTDVTGPNGASAPTITGVGGSQLKVALSFDPSTAFWTDLNTKGLSVHFASATCANDVVDGTLAPVTEPGTLLLLGGGLVGMVAVGRRRFIRR